MRGGRFKAAWRKFGPVQKSAARSNSLFRAALKAAWRIFGPVQKSAVRSNFLFRASLKAPAATLEVETKELQRVTQICVCVFYVASLFARSGLEQLSVQIHLR